MKITKNGVLFINYRTAAPGTHLSSFTDGDGGTLLISTQTLVRMYELVKFDLEKRNCWQIVLGEVEKAYDLDEKYGEPVIRTPNKV